MRSLGIVLGCLTITVVQKAAIRAKRTNPRRRIALRRGSFMLKNGKSLDFKRFSGIEKVHRNSIKITVDLWRSRRDLNPRYPFGVHTISSRARYDHFDTAPYSVALHQTAHIYYYEPMDLSIAFFTFFAFFVSFPKLNVI